MTWEFTVEYYFSVIYNIVQQCGGITVGNGAKYTYGMSLLIMKQNFDNYQMDLFNVE